jgi:hypothetical protein
MAQNTVIQLIDDITGLPGDDIETVIFSLDGVDYEMELAENNAVDLRDRLSEFIAKAKRTGGRLRKPTAATPAARSDGGSGKRGPEQLAKVRAWARREGYTVAEVGRVSQAVLDAYDADQDKPSGKSTGRRARRS